METKIFKESFSEIKIKFAVQYKPVDREKPLGTSDALMQAMDQHEVLKRNSFVIINGDNLYSVNSLNSLLNYMRNSMPLLVTTGMHLIFRMSV